MAAYGIEGLLDAGVEWQILGLHHLENSKNKERWRTIQNFSAERAERFTIEASPTTSSKFQAVKRHFQTKAIQLLKERIESYDPDLILVIQGNIEQSASLFRLKDAVKCPIISYIPLPHTHAEMGARLGRLRDITCRKLYSQPDGFITISESLGKMLRMYGGNGRIEIVENGIDLNSFNAMPSREIARTQLELPQSGYLWGQVGRVEFKQKGQDKTLQAFLNWQKKHPEDAVVFVGSGPDSEALRVLCEKVKNAHCIPWVSDVSPILAAIDALILPSRYEGVPLVMLEALANGIPVVASNRDGMQDWLPSTWLFDPNTLQSIVHSMEELRGSSDDVISSIRDRVRAACNLDKFKSNFNHTLQTWL